MDLQKCINSQLYGSSVIDNAIAQVFNANPLDMKLDEIRDILSRNYTMELAHYVFDPRSLTFKFYIVFCGITYGVAIPDSVMIFESVYNIIRAITENVLNEHSHVDFEYMFENENEQAMLDAAMDYGFV